MEVLVAEVAGYWIRVLKVLSSNPIWTFVLTEPQYRPGKQSCRMRLIASICFWSYLDHIEKE